MQALGNIHSSGLQITKQLRSQVSFGGGIASQTLELKNENETC